MNRYLAISVWLFSSLVADNAVAQGVPPASSAESSRVVRTLLNSAEYAHTLRTWLSSEAGSRSDTSNLRHAVRVFAPVQVAGVLIAQVRLGEALVAIQANFAVIGNNHVVLLNSAELGEIQAGLSADALNHVVRSAERTPSLDEQASRIRYACLIASLARGVFPGDACEAGNPREVRLNNGFQLDFSRYRLRIVLSREGQLLSQALLRASEQRPGGQ